MRGQLVDPLEAPEEAAVDIGRIVTYTYDAGGRLSTVADPENNVTTYTWDTSNRLATIKDGRNIVYLTNEYTNGRVTKQTLADPSATYTYAYTTDPSGTITQTEITDPRQHTERLVFDATTHYVVSDTAALNTAQQRTTTFERQTGGNFPTAVLDDVLVEGQRRRTEYSYDDFGHALTITRLAGTAGAATTTFTYEPTYFQLATVTDPLNHTSTLTYDATGRLTGSTDPLTHQTTIGTNAAGQVTSVTDPLQHKWQWGYSGPDLVSTTDPLNFVSRRFVDAAGRVLSTTDPLGRVTRMTVDKLNRVTSVTDAIGGQNQFQYDPNSRLLSLTDALTHATGYTYDASNRIATRIDPLQKSASYVYDSRSNATQTTDRKGQVTQHQYDALDRLSQVTYADTSTTQYTYDPGDRLTQVVDSVGGTITRTFDGLDRLMSETTPEGSVSYTYDPDGRRATMTIAGQPQVAYGYDDAHRLTSITQGPSVISFTYDDANRRSTLTLPNAIVTIYVYDNANQLMSLTYTVGPTTLGDLTYTYDSVGNRTTVGGSWARAGLPQPLASATYDAANRVQTWAGQVFSHDANGDLVSDGLTGYTWNARDQLSGVSGAPSATFGYDGVGRRRNLTVGSTSSSFVYDDTAPIQVLSGGTPTVNLLTGLGIDETFVRTTSTGTQTLLTDSLGSTIALADTSGALQNQYTFESFGAVISSGPASSNSIQFTGRENDNTGTFYYRARYYSPQLSRFISEDPLGFGGGDANLYAYAANNPINTIDPTGCSFIDCARALAELVRAEADLLRRMAEKAAAERQDYGHDKSIEQARNRLKNAVQKARHCLTAEEMRKYLEILGSVLVIGGAVGVAITVPELVPFLPWLVPTLVR